MKRVTVLTCFIVILTGAMVFCTVAPATAVDRDEEVEALKEMIRELETRREEDINRLRQRIDRLERKKAAETPAGEVGELKQSLSELESKVGEQRSFYDRMMHFMEEHKLKAGLRTQTWYQFVEDGEDAGREDLHDFMIRRFYFYLKGQVIPNMGFFAHIAGDRLGQDGLDREARNGALKSPFCKGLRLGEPTPRRGDIRGILKRSEIPPYPRLQNGGINKES